MFRISCAAVRGRMWEPNGPNPRPTHPKKKEERMTPDPMGLHDSCQFHFRPYFGLATKLK